MNVSDSSCRENKKTSVMFCLFFSEIMPFMRQCGKICRAGEATDDNIAVRMRIACWIQKATHKHTHTHTQRIGNTAFTPQRLLRTSTLPVFFLSWCFYCNGSFCHTCPIDPHEVLIYVARLSHFHLIPMPH